MSGFGKFELPLFHGLRVQYFQELCIMMHLISLVIKTARGTVC